MEVLITGASSGIGLEIAKRLAAEGHHITLLARNQEKLDRAVQSLSGNRHRTYKADLDKKEDLVSVKDLIEKEHFDVLINNAGFGIYGNFIDVPIENQLRMMQLNMNALTQLSYTYLKQAEKGNALINTASVLGESCLPGSAVYAATKSYVIGLSNALWAENKSRGVFVSAFCPGATKTKFHEISGGAQDVFPGFMMQTPELVARSLVRSLEKRSQPRNISGLLNKILVFSNRLVSNKMLVNIMARFSPTR